jgi:hypothetical protein
MKNPPKLMDYLKVQRDMQWSSARVLFKDLHGYKTYINTCPDIRQYLTLKMNDRKKSQVDLTIHKYPPEIVATLLRNEAPNDDKTAGSQGEHDSTIHDTSQNLEVEWDAESQEENRGIEEEDTSFTLKDTQSHISNSYTADGDTITTVTVDTQFPTPIKTKCRMNILDINNLINMLMTNGLADTRARYYTKWQTWQDDKQKLTLDDFEEFFYMLRLTLPNIQWEWQDGEIYYESYIRNEESPTVILDSLDKIPELHTLIFPTIRQWATPTDGNTTWEQEYWKNAITWGLTGKATALDIERFLGSHNIYKYYCLLTFCIEVKELCKIKYDKGTRIISYNIPAKDDKHLGATPTRSNATHPPHTAPPKALNVPNLRESKQKDEHINHKSWSIMQAI